MHTVKWLNSSIWSIDGSLTITTTLGQSGPKSNSNEGILRIHQNFRTGTTLSDDLVSYLGYSFGVEVLPLWNDTVRAIYSPSEQY